MNNKILFGFLMISLSTATFGTSSVSASSQMTFETSQQLPQAIVAGGQMIFADLDNTIVEGPSKGKEPLLRDSPAYTSLLNWLKAGGRITFITGAELQRMIQRVINDIPVELRKQIYFAANNGSSLACFDEKGDIVEDFDFMHLAIQGGIYLSKEHEEHILTGAVDVINRLHARLLEEPDLFTKLNLPRKFNDLVECAQERDKETSSPYTKEELISVDTDKLPRIEVRRNYDKTFITSIALIGIPDEFDLSLLGINEKEIFATEQLGLHLSRIGFTFELTREGVDKQTSVRWLEKHYDVNLKKSFALADAPTKADKPLTNILLDDGSFMPFVSVAPSTDGLPEHLHNFHIGNTTTGSAKLLDALLQAAQTIHASGREDPVIPTKLSDLIAEIQRS